MKDKITKALITTALLSTMAIGFVAFITNKVEAAGEKFYIENIVAQGGTLMGAWTIEDNNAGSLIERLVTWNTSGVPYASEQELTDAAKGAVVSWANTTGGFSGIVSDDVYTYIPKLADVAKSGLWSDIVSKPTTLSGYGITDGQTLLVSGTNIKTINGSSILGSGNIQFKKVETYSGTTDASGIYTATFGTAYSVAPNIQANIINGTDTQFIRITSVSTTGFTVLVRNRTDIAGLLPTFSNVNGASVDVLITQK